MSDERRERDIETARELRGCACADAPRSRGRACQPCIRVAAAIAAARAEGASQGRADGLREAARLAREQGAVYAPDVSDRQYGARHAALSLAKWMDELATGKPIDWPAVVDPNALAATSAPPRDAAADQARGEGERTAAPRHETHCPHGSPRCGNCD